MRRAAIAVLALHHVHYACGDEGEDERIQRRLQAKDQRRANQYDAVYHQDRRAKRNALPMMQQARDHVGAARRTLPTKDQAHADAVEQPAVQHI